MPVKHILLGAGNHGDVRFAVSLHLEIFLAQGIPVTLQGFVFFAVSSHILSLSNNRSFFSDLDIALLHTAIFDYFAINCAVVILPENAHFWKRDKMWERLILLSSEMKS